MERATEQEPEHERERSPDPPARPQALPAAFAAGNQAVAHLAQSAPATLARLVGAKVALSDSVGRGGANKPADQATVRELLKAVGIDDADLDAAIERYQREVLGFRKPDGRVDPGGKTFKKLRAGKGAHKPAPGPKSTADPAPAPAPAPKAPPGPPPTGLLNWPQILPVAKRTKKTKISYKRGDWAVTVPEIDVPEFNDAQKAILEQIKANREALPEYAMKKASYGGSKKGAKKKVAPMHGLALGDSGAKEKLTPAELRGAATSKEMKAKQVAWKELGHEGTLDSINTYDNQILTWGKGFSAKSGSMNEVLELMFKTDPEAKVELLKAGIYCDRDPANWMVVNRDTGMIEKGTNALYLLQFDAKLLGVFVTLGRDPKHQEHALNAQWKAMSKPGKAAAVPAFAYDWPDTSIALAAHLSHWTPAMSWAKPTNRYESTGGDLVRIAGRWSRVAAARKWSTTTTLPNGAIIPPADMMEKGHRLGAFAGGSGAAAVKSAHPAVTIPKAELASDRFAGHVLLRVHGTSDKYHDIGEAGS